jgi:phosphoglycerol geranylgeranyltransferase
LILRKYIISFALYLLVLRALKNNQIYSKITKFKATNKKSIAVLIDPDVSEEIILKTIRVCKQNHVDFIFAGGSLLYKGKTEDCVKLIKSNCDIPVILFPGNEIQITDEADALLFLSLISGRNSEYLIGKHVISAPFLAQSSLEVLPTGYMLVDGGKETTASYISNTKPLPADKPGIAMATAMAGEMLGLKLIYMDAGSGAQKSISTDMIQLVKEHISIPLIVGGGIKTAAQANAIWNAGADVIVVGNILESAPEMLSQIMGRMSV